MRNISPNKINDRQKRRAEHIAEQLMKQGVGRDEAHRRAIAQSVNEDPGSLGGGKNAGGEARKGES